MSYQNPYAMSVERLKECMALLNWEPKYLAQKLRVEPKTVKAWLSGKSWPPLTVSAWLERRVEEHRQQISAIDR